MGHSQEDLTHLLRLSPRWVIAPSAEFRMHCYLNILHRAVEDTAPSFTIEDDVAERVQYIKSVLFSKENEGRFFDDYKSALKSLAGALGYSHAKNLIQNILEDQHPTPESMSSNAEGLFHLITSNTFSTYIQAGYNQPVMADEINLLSAVILLNKKIEELMRSFSALTSELKDTTWHLRDTRAALSRSTSSSLPEISDILDLLSTLAIEHGTDR